MRQLDRSLERRKYSLNAGEPSENSSKGMSESEMEEFGQSETKGGHNSDDSASTSHTAASFGHSDSSASLTSSVLQNSGSSSQYFADGFEWDRTQYSQSRDFVPKPCGR